MSREATQLLKSVEALERSERSYGRRLEEGIKAAITFVVVPVYGGIAAETAKLAEKVPEAGIPLLVAETALAGYGLYKLWRME